MGDNTKIEWADATLNYANGCTVHSPGCTNCYAMKQAHRFPVRQGLTVKTKGGMVWNGEVRENPRALQQALAWKRGRTIFWNAHGDLFHKDVPDEWIDRQFATCALTPQHTHMILTKRSDRMLEYMTRLTADGQTRWAADILSDAAHDIGIDEDSCCAVANWVNGFSRWRHAPDDDNPLDGSKPRWPLPNVMLGVSVENQEWADERREDFTSTPAAIKFVSYEPALGPVDWEGWEFVDQIIGGGESGPKARPAHPDWFRETRDFCTANGIAYFHKQNGEFAPGEIAGEYLNPERAAKGMSYFDGRWDECWSEPEGHCDDEPDVYRIGKKRAGRLLDGVTHNGTPAHD